MYYVGPDIDQVLLQKSSPLSRQLVYLMFSPGIIDYIDGFKIKSTEKIVRSWNYVYSVE